MPGGPGGVAGSGTVGAMELILVRHGEPAWVDDTGRGHNDPGLTDRGREQAGLAAERLAATDDDPEWGDLDRVFASPAVRAQETAAPIATALGLPVETQEWLWEIRNPPQWEGAPIEEVQEAFAQQRAADRQWLWDGFPGGESPRDFHRRNRDGLIGFLAEFDVTPTEDPVLWDDQSGPSGDRVVIVAHGGTNSMIICHLLGVEAQPWSWEHFTMGHASVARLVTQPMAGAHIWSLRALGDATHISVPDRTI